MAKLGKRMREALEKVEEITGVKLQREQELRKLTKDYQLLQVYILLKY